MKLRPALGGRRLKPLQGEKWLITQFLKVNSILENQIKEVETEIYNYNDPAKLHNLSVMKGKYYKLSSDRVARSIMLTKQTYYDQGKKSGKLLAWRIKKMQAERTINSIKSIAGKLTTDPLEINNNFRDFNEMLYKSEYRQAGKEQNAFLDQSEFWLISDDEKTALDSPLTTEELYVKL